ncbi:exodeoxyribonuclease V subunit alpha [Kineococcus gynurae]|uniref:RecBCD enzyme subunit RecD n=1 Tax=Kineococcus gynurae TaxID=452979 RepID=A0ABV5LNW8_9ACTN
MTIPPAVPAPPAPEADRRAARALRAQGLLARFNELTYLHSADVHVARRLGALAGEDDERVLLAVALTVRAVRHGSVVLRLRRAPVDVTPEDAEDSGDAGPLAAPPWPEPEAWVAAVRGSRLSTVHHGGDDTAGVGRTPLHVVGDDVWLDRYWRQEVAVAEDLRRRATAVPAAPPEEVRPVLDRLWPGAGGREQREAAEVCLGAGVAVLGGGPGTGKTTTVARLLAAVHALSHGLPRVALAAPTGKAAARLTEAVSAAAASPEFTAAEREFLTGATATTLHGLLGLRPGSGRPRYDAERRLPHDVVIVDEASMVGLPVMARLLAALRPSARLVLVGDRNQLASVEVGAVLADLTPSEGPPGPHGVTTLRQVHRFDSGGAIGELARAVEAGEVDAVLDQLRAATGAAGGGVRFLEVEEGDPIGGAALDALHASVLGAARAMVGAARAGDAVAAVRALEGHRVLCAHRRGLRGVSAVTGLALRWTVAELGVALRPDGFHVGMPVLVTANDPGTRTWNGDTGVVMEVAGETVVAIGRGEGPVLVPLARLAGVETLHAMTVHRSQGSQFDAVTVVTAPARSPLATRQMLYTALTRARREVCVIGSAEALARAVEREAIRATGLTGRLRA